MLKNRVFGSFNLNNSEKYRLSFEDILLGTLDTNTKKMNPPSAVLGGGVHGKVCWLIAYNTSVKIVMLFSRPKTLEKYKNIHNINNDNIYNGSNVRHKKIEQ